MEAALMIDIGSTFTKACSIDLSVEKILATVCTPSTTNTDVSEGIDKAVQLLDTVIQKKIDYKLRLATSSAAGGLRIAVVGLVPELTLKAGKLSAYNAGAKIVGAFSYKLTNHEIDEIENLNPDILLLVGGTDGGNEDVLLWNANMISQLGTGAPIIFGGNKVVASEVKAILEKKGKTVFSADNVLSRIGKINTFAAKEMIRKIFIERIVISKGIDRARRCVDEDIIPTPLAVFNAVKLLSAGSDREKGLGELMAIDIGGATTDVYSSASGVPTLEGTILKGLPLPCDMRTVEGDLGLRINATTTLKEADLNKVVKNQNLGENDLRSIAEKFSNNVSINPKTHIEKTADLEIASYAIQIALNRHAGYLEKQYTPMGEIDIQYGKDLTAVKTILCTGGIFSHTRERELLEMLDRSIGHNYEPFCLKPESPNYLIDYEYILFAMGLLSTKYPDKALKILKQNLKQID